MAAVIRHAAPDLIVLQEATQPGAVARIASALGMRHYASRQGTRWRSSAAIRSRIMRGTGLADRGMRSSRWCRPAIPAVSSACTCRPCTRPGRSNAGCGAARAARAIARHQHGLHLLAGDFNTLAPGERLDLHLLPRRLRALVWLSGGRIRWRTIQRILDAGYADAFRTLHPTEPGPTFPTWHPHIRLDYAFLPATFVARVQACEVITIPETRDASNYFPVLIDLEV